MFKLIVKKEFSSAHILHGHPGDCKRMHGHNWIVEAKVEGDHINSIGMVIDFKDIKTFSDIKEIHDEYVQLFYLYINTQSDKKLKDKAHGLIKDKESAIKGKPVYVRIVIKNKKIEK